MEAFSSGSNTSLSNNSQSALTFFPRSYAMSGKIMLSAVVILFVVVLLILCLHVYARWYLLRRQQQRRRRQRRVLVFSSDLRHAHPAAAASATGAGLDPAVLSSLPVFEYAAPADSEEDDEGEEEMECAVCLCEFREKDRGRTLPGCKHSFHIECIDMWFSSHSTCPLCRSKVEPPAVMDPIAILQTTRAPKPCDLCDSCRGGSSLAKPVRSSSPGSSASSGEHRIEAPPMRVGEEFKPPVSRILTIRSILSSDSIFYRGGAGDGGGAASEEPDLESGEGPVTTTPPPPPPPRRA